MARLTKLMGLILLLLAACDAEPPEPAEELALPAYSPPAAQVPVSHARMLRALQQVARDTPDAHPYLGSLILRDLKQRLARLDAKAPASDRWRLLLDLGLEELDRGNEARALELLRQAEGLLSPRDSTSTERMQTHFALGVANLRFGETQNCCLRHLPESCIVPIADAAVHHDRRGSERAAFHFRQLVKRLPQDSPHYRMSRWLLNLAVMTLGEYPDSVALEHRVPPETFKSSVDFPRFRNVAGELGLATFSLCGGIIVDDFNNDDRLDVMVSNWDTLGQLRYFQQTSSGKFIEKTEEANLKGLFGGLNLIQADYDNDGFVDVLVLRGAWIARWGRHPNSLLRNNGDGTFTDVTFDAGLGEVHYPTQTADWGDYDNDGDLDLFIGNETAGGDEDLFGGGANSPYIEAPCQLFRNEGDGTFTDVAEAAGVTNLRYAKGVVWGDYDGDGWLDLYVSNLKDDNRLYHNQGDGTFVDKARELGVHEPDWSFPVWFWDYNNDGALDIFVGSYTGRIHYFAAWSWGEDLGVGSAYLYEGDGNGGFEEVSAQRGLRLPILPMGSNFGDLDNDGYPDFYLGTGDPHFYSLMPNLMFLNREGGEFVDVTMAGGFGHLQKGHGIAFADIDADGDLDVLQQTGGSVPGDGYNDVVYENPGFGNHWLTVHLIGIQSNRSAIGARLRLQVDRNGRKKTIYGTVDTGGSFGANPLRQTLGLGQADRIDFLEIRWPASGSTQRFEKVPVDCMIRIREGDKSWDIVSPVAGF